MNKKLKTCVLLLSSLLTAACRGDKPKTVRNDQAAAVRPVAARPPMGWNSFDSYGVYLHEKAAFANVEAMARKLKPAGYEYFVVDNGWFGEYHLREGTLYPNEKHASDVRIDEYGLLQPSETYFPNGLKPLIDRTHALGLKFGIHLMRGIPRKACKQNTPIKGMSFFAGDVTPVPAPGGPTTTA